MFDSTNFDILRRILPGVPSGEKQAFTASPGVQEAVMAQGQGATPGGDPAQMAAMAGGAGGAPGGMDPGAIQAGAGAGGPPPGATDPAAAGGAPPAPGGAAPPSDVPDPMTSKLDQILQVLQQQQGGGQGGTGPNGKPNTASIKFEPAHFQQMSHKISVMESIMRQMADQMGLQVPASEMFSVGAPGQPLPGQPGQAPQGAAPQAGQQPPSNVAQQLPNLPPVAAKAASDDDISRLRAGFPVAPEPNQHRLSAGASLAVVASLFAPKAVR